MSNLPKGWIEIKFTDVLDVQGGTQPPKSTFMDIHSAGYIRLLQIRDFGKRPVPTFVPDTGKLKTCEEDDVFIARYGASLGRILTGKKGAYNVALAKVIIPEQINKRYIYYYLQSHFFQNPLAMLQRTAQNGFNKTDLSNFPVYLPPYNEQGRIVKKLDTIFEQLNETKARLNRVPDLLKKFRQSILDAACTGKLTADWREQRELNMKGSWSKVKISDISPKVTVGFVGKMSDQYIESGVPFFRGQNVRPNKFNHKNTLFISEKFHKKIIKSALHPGDVLVVRSGSVGSACIMPDDYVEANCSDLVIIKKGNFESEYLAYYINSISQSTISEGQVGVALQHFNTKSVAALEINLPSLDEQKEIVKRVELFFLLVDGIAKKIIKVANTIEKAESAILKFAFEGFLVNQDPNDEPASVLLEKIKAEREVVKTKKKTKKRAIKKKTSKKKNALSATNPSKKSSPAT